MRNGEQEGREHHFVTKDKMPSKKEMLAYTKFGEHHYWALHSQVPQEGICTYVIDEKGLLTLDENYGDEYTLFPVLVKMDKEKLQADTERIKRDKCRIRLSEEWFQLIIDNNGTLEEFKSKIQTKITTIINENPIFEHFKMNRYGSTKR